MTIHLLEQVATDRARVRRAGMRERLRMRLEMAALALAGCFALGLVIFDEPARRRPEVSEQQALGACSRVYDQEACDCALRATAARVPGNMSQNGALLAAGSAPSSPGSTEAVIRVSDFAHLVQACMAPHGDAPVD